MRISVRFKLVLIFIIVITVPMVVITSISLWFTLERLEKDFMADSVQALNKARHIMFKHARQAENIAALLSDTSEIKDRLGSGEIQEVLEAKHDLWFTAIVEVFDRDKKLLARTYGRGAGRESFFTNPRDDVVAEAGGYLRRGLR